MIIAEIENIQYINESESETGPWHFVAVALMTDTNLKRNPDPTFLLILKLTLNHSEQYLVA
jgi:hypothetical protein